MKGTIFDFLKFASEQPELTKELVELAARHQFEFTDEVSDEQLEAVAGGNLSDERRWQPLSTLQSATRRDLTWIK